jgi:hypothetical protein
MAMPNRRVTDHKPQYTPPALFFELEREFKAVARQATSCERAATLTTSPAAQPP